jgi:hypothetical protein
VYAKHNTKKYHGARMYNNSRGGMNLVSNRPLKPGSDICIKMENYSAGTSNPDEFRAEVIWCKDVSNVYASYYGKYECGVEYHAPLDIIK